MSQMSNVRALTFDVFGTVLDLGGSLTPYLADFLQELGAGVPPDTVWADWRARQRLEQFQDTLMMLGHSGYLETARRALVYALAQNGIHATRSRIEQFMDAWQHLMPFDDVIPALHRLSDHYQLVVLSNGEPEFLNHLAANQIQWSFDEIISVSTVGAFKPHPAVYRRAAAILGLEMGQCLMVSANSFDVVGARACGFRAVYVNRYGLPYEDTLYQPDQTVASFRELADTLIGQTSR